MMHSSTYTHAFHTTTSRCECALERHAPSTLITCGHVEFAFVSYTRHRGRAHTRGEDWHQDCACVSPTPGVFFSLCFCFAHSHTKWVLTKTLWVRIRCHVLTFPPSLARRVACGLQVFRVEGFHYGGLLSLITSLVYCVCGGAELRGEPRKG
jgi:hypothetical protein